MEGSNAIENNFEVSTKYVRLLNEIGYVAVGQGLQQDSENIFEALSLIRPNSELPLIGLAFCKMNFGKFKEAASVLLERASKINPNSDLIKAFFALILVYGKQAKKGKSIVESIIAESSDDAAVTLAQSILESIK